MTMTAESAHSTAAARAFSAKREQILEGAEAVFLEHGYEGASMSQIARKAGVSKGTLYNHFVSKDDLFHALITRLCSGKIASMFQVFEKEEAECLPGLIQVAEALIKILVSPPALNMHRIIIAEAPKFPELANAFWQAGPDTLRRHLSKWLTQWHDAGVLHIADPVFATDQFLALCQTRIVIFRRFEMPVDTSDAAIREIAVITGEAFYKIYRHH